MWKQADTNPPINTALDEQRIMYYSANWQLLEERIDVEASFPTSSEAGTSADIDKHMQYIWGSRYIDDLAMRRLDANKNGSFTDGGDKIYYHCTDAMFSTVCVLSDTGQTLERISYDPYGKARQFEPEDMDGDGDVDVADRNIVLANLGSVPVPGDVDRDGEWRGARGTARAAGVSNRLCGHRPSDLLVLMARGNSELARNSKWPKEP